MLMDKERGDGVKAYHDQPAHNILPVVSEGDGMNILQGEEFADQLAYWRQHLKGSEAALQLPTDYHGLSAHTLADAGQSFMLPPPLSAALHTLSQQEGVSLFMTLLASFQALLLRYTGQHDLLIGTPIIGRRQTKATDLIVSFVNVLVLRTDASGDPTFQELLRRVRELVLEAYAHRDVPFERVVQALQPEQGASKRSLIQVMFVLEPAPREMPDASELDLRSMQVDLGTAWCDLILWLQETESGLKGRLRYSDDLFEGATIMRLVGHWQTLLEGIVAHPGQRIADLSLLTKAERQQLVIDWNDTATDYPRDQSLHQLFEAQVERTPEAVALVYDGRQLTYRELNRHANQLAHHLQQMGVGTEARVALCIERSLEMVVGILGILKAGGAYVPLDPAYPQERLAFMLEDAEPSVLLTQQHLLDRLPPHDQVVCLDTDWKMFAQQSDANISSGIEGQNLAYLLYTSGSTGQPKSVLGTHRAAINRFHWMWTTYPFEPEEVCCQKTALSFVDSVWEIFGPLLQGIRTVIIPDLVVKDFQRLLYTLAAHAVTRIVLVPSLLRVLLETASDLPDRLPQLKYWVSSGEALPVDLVLRFRERMPHSVLLNLYGSSEVAADTTYYDTRNYHSSLTRIPIGRPIANTQVYLLDQQMHLVPIGVPGELYVGGDGLARGYFNRPELTVARFVLNPFSSESGARLYKTGDWGRYLADGNIEYLGRLDHQVKIRGFRIELGEIEAVLLEHPTVRQAVVVAREDKPGDKKLVAHVVLHEGQSMTSADLQRHAMKRLPTYMLPAAFVLLEALPLTPNGKVDRQALPDPERVQSQETSEAPHTQLEETIADILAQVLEIEQMGIHDNFFTLGGHSLLAMQVISRLQTLLQVEVPLSSFLEAPTVAQLAQILKQLQASSPKLSRPALRSISRQTYRVSSVRQTSDSSNE